MVQHGLPRPYFLLFNRDNVTHIKNDQQCMGLFFIDNFIFWLKFFFLTKIKKVSFREKF